ncbi:MAG: hypothetical protein QG650_867, partial [Patescibacteria group bacterium]|nr:hypothetical protein [Patescibacteria group bacterium]
YGGIRLRFFSELPQSVGLGFDSVSGMLLISALERLSGTIDGRLVDEIKRKNLADAWREYSDVLGNLFKTSYGYLIDAYQSFPITGNTVASFYE